MLTQLDDCTATSLRRLIAIRGKQLHILNVDEPVPGHWEDESQPQLLHHSNQRPCLQLIFKSLALIHGFYWFPRWHDPK